MSVDQAQTVEAVRVVTNQHVCVGAPEVEAA